MDNRLLLPNSFKRIGWVLLIPATVAGILLQAFGIYDIATLELPIFALASNELFGKTVFFSTITTNIIPSLVSVIFLIGCWFVGFSKEKTEDEYIANIRLTSLLWAVLLNTASLFICVLFVWGTFFLSVMLYNMFTTLLIFIIRFNYLIYKNNKESKHEKQN